jgi:hypothetical protein
MNARRLAFAAVLAVVLTAGSAFAQTGWLVPPPFEVQRDAYWNFDRGPSYPPEYYGPDDPILFESDFVEWGGLNTPEGVAGIDNSNGTEDMSGLLFIHFDNWKVTNPVKLIWLQADVYEAGGGDVWLEITDDTGATIPWQTVALQQIPGTDVWTQVVTAQIRPNPPFENFVFNYAVPAGGVAWVDNVHIATACVPEPGLISVVGLGLGVAGMALRRRI